MEHIHTRLTAQLLFHGMTAPEFVSAVEGQFAKPSNARGVSAAFLRAIEVMVSMTVDRSNQLLYTRDEAHPNMHYFRSMSRDMQALFRPAEGGHGGNGSTKALASWGVRLRSELAPLQRGQLRFQEHQLGHVALSEVLAAHYGSRQTSLARSYGRQRATALHFGATQTKGAPSAAPKPFSPLRRADSIRLEAENFTRPVDAKGAPVAADCEDVAFGAAAVKVAMEKILTSGLYERLQPMERERWAALEKWEQAEALRRASMPANAAWNVTQTRELRCLLQVAALYRAFGVGASVSEPYLETAASAAAAPPGSVAAKAAAPKHIQLGAPGDPIFDKRTEMGHGVALMLSTAFTHASVKKGLAATPLHPEDQARVAAYLDRALAAQPRWAADLPAATGEGTGYVKPLNMPTELYAFASESERQLETRKTASLIRFSRALKLGASAEHAAIAQVAKIQGMPYEPLARKNPRQALSPFYDHFVQFISAEVAEDLGDERLSHFLLVNLRNNTRGLLFHELMLPAGGRAVEGVEPALASIYASDMSRAEYEATVAPPIRRVSNMLPVAGWARGEKPSPAHQGRLLSSVQVAQLAARPFGSLQEVTHAFDAVCRLPVQFGAAEGALGAEGSSAQDLALIQAAEARGQHTILRLEVPEWQFAASEKRPAGQPKIGDLVGALDRLKARGDIAAYAFVRDQPLVQANSTLRLLLAVPVIADMATVEREFPRA